MWGKTNYSDFIDSSTCAAIGYVGILRNKKKNTLCYLCEASNQREHDGGYFNVTWGDSARRILNRGVYSLFDTEDEVLSAYNRPRYIQEYDLVRIAKVEYKESVRIFE